MDGGRLEWGGWRIPGNRAPSPSGPCRSLGLKKQTMGSITVCGWCITMVSEDPAPPCCCVPQHHVTPHASLPGLRRPRLVGRVGSVIPSSGATGASHTANPLYLPPPLGLRTEQDLYVRLIDSMSKQVSEARACSGRSHPPLGASEGASSSLCLHPHDLAPQFLP